MIDNMSHELKQEIITACKNWELRYSHKHAVQTYTLTADMAQLRIKIMDGFDKMDIELKFEYPFARTIISVNERIFCKTAPNPVGAIVMTTLQHDLLDICRVLTRRRITCEHQQNRSTDIIQATEKLNQINAAVMKSKKQR